MGQIVKKSKGNFSVSVDEDLAGKEREHSICYRCHRLLGGNVNDNCKIENILYAVSSAFGLSVPVYACPAFTEKQKEEPKDGTENK